MGDVPRGLHFGGAKEFHLRKARVVTVDPTKCGLRHEAEVGVIVGGRDVDAGVPSLWGLGQRKVLEEDPRGTIGTTNQFPSLGGSPSQIHRGVGLGVDVHVGEIDGHREFELNPLTVVGCPTNGCGVRRTGATEPPTPRGVVVDRTSLP